MICPVFWNGISTNIHSLNINPVSAMTYLLLREGPYRLFGISKEKFENILRYLQEDKNGIVKVELGKGLDNIRLREDLNYTEVLELLSKDI